MYRQLCCFFAFLMCISLANAQTNGKIKLQNPSLEGIPKEANTPKGWQPCGYYSTPDILPGAWGVAMTAHHGKSFVGLTAREDNTNEALGQLLTTPLQKGECYSMGVDLARSDAYASYNRPIRLRVWGGTDACDKAQLLGVSPTISNTDWKRFTIYFFPKKAYKFLLFEAHYANGTTVPYRGNILIDNIGDLEICIRADASDVTNTQSSN